MKDESGNVMLSSKAVLKRWMEYFEKLINEENAECLGQRKQKWLKKKVNCVSREVKNSLKRMKKGKTVGPDDLPVEVWKCSVKMWIKFSTRLLN